MKLVVELVYGGEEGVKYDVGVYLLEGVVFYVGIEDVVKLLFVVFVECFEFGKVRFIEVVLFVVKSGDRGGVFYSGLDVEG